MSSALPVISQDSERKRRAISTNWYDKRRRYHRRRCRVAVEYSVSRVMERHAALCTINVGNLILQRDTIRSISAARIRPVDSSRRKRVFSKKKTRTSDRYCTGN